MGPPEPKGAACPCPPHSPRSPLSSTATTGSPQGPSSPSLPHDPRHLRPGLGSLRGERSRRGLSFSLRRMNPLPRLRMSFLGRSEGKKQPRCCPRGKREGLPPPPPCPPQATPGWVPGAGSPSMLAPLPPRAGTAASPRPSAASSELPLCAPGTAAPFFQEKEAPPTKKEAPQSSPPPSTGL